MKIGVIVQARMGSTRLSGKVMKPIKGKTILNHVIERLKQSTLADSVTIATTNLNRDDIIEAEAIKSGAMVFRGSESDVLSRYYEAAKQEHLDIVVRVTSDCPLIDSKLLDQMIDFYVKHDYQVVTNVGNDIQNRTFPRGLDIEIFSFNALEDAFKHAEEQYQREHVTPYLYENISKVYYYKNDVDFSGYRWTVDTQEDFTAVEKIYEHLYHGEHDFYLKDIVQLFKEHPELHEINAHVEQKKTK